MAKDKHDSSGYYLTLKNRSIPVSDRLKLVRFAWGSRDVFIPNKEQVLVDLLFGMIVNKKQEQLNAEDCGNVWECLNDILNTKKAHVASRIMLRQSSSQVMLNALCSEDSVPEDKVTCLFGTCLAVLKSPNMSAIFSSRPEDMVVLLTGLCKRLGTQPGEVISFPAISDFVTHTVKLFVNMIRAAPNQNMILRKCCEHLLPQFIPLWTKDCSKNVQMIGDAVNQILCHRDHVQSYELYLTAQRDGDVQSGQKKVKFLHQLMETLQMLMKGEDGDQCCRFLPEFYRSFIQAQCYNGNKKVAHLMMTELYNLIGLHHSNSSLDSSNRQVAPSTMLKGLNSMLRQVIVQELYDPTSESADIQLQFYKNVTSALILQAKTNKVNADWFSCLRSLLQLDHQVLESSLIDLFTLVFMTAEIEAGSEIDCDLLLGGLVSTYSKLRQVPRFIRKLLAALGNNCSLRKAAVHPIFWERFAEMVQVLPQVVMVEVWKLFNTALVEKMVPHASDDGATNVSFNDLVELYCAFLLNVKVADYTVTDLTLTSVTGCIVTIETDLLKPLLSYLADSKQPNAGMLSSSLFVCHALGEVLLMMSEYKQYRTSGYMHADVIMSSDVLTLVHSYLDAQQWKTLYKMICTLNLPDLQYVWDLLSLQKVRCVLLHQSSEVMTSIALDPILTFTQMNDTKSSHLMWNGKLGDVTSTNLIVARWHALASNLAAVLHTLTTGQRHSIAGFILKSLLVKRDNKTSSAWSLDSITEKYVFSKLLPESGPLLNDVITCLWQHCAQALVQQAKSPKKGKKTRGSTSSSLGELLTCMSGPDMPWNKDMTEACLSSVEKAAALLKQLFCSEDVSVPPTAWDIIHSCCQILERIPLAELWSCDQVRCLIGLLALSTVANKDPSSKQVLKQCTKLSTLIVSECGRIPVFQVLDVASYLLWMQQTLDRDHGSLEYLLLVEVSCSTMVSDYRVLESLSTHTQQLVKVLPQKSAGSITLVLFLLKDVCKLLNRQYLNESLRLICTEIYGSLAKPLLQLSPLLNSPELSHMEALLVRCLAAILSIVHKEDVVKMEILNTVPSAVDWCLKILDTDLDDVGVHTILSSLWFLHTVARSHIALGDVLTQNLKARIWEGLVKTVQKLLAVKSGQQASDADTSSGYLENSGYDLLKTSDLSPSSTKKRKIDPIDVSTKRLRKSKAYCQTEQLEEVMEMGTDQAQSLHDILGVFSSKSLNSLHASSAKINKQSVLNKDSNTNEKSSVVSTEHQMEAEIVGVGTNSWLPGTSIQAQFQCLMYEGRVEAWKHSLCLQQTQAVLAAVLVAFDMIQFQKVLRKLETDMSILTLQADRQTFITSMYIWRHLLKLEFTDKQTKCVRLVARDLMLNYQTVLSEIHQCRDPQLTREIMLPLLDTQLQMIALGKKFLPSRVSVQCLHSCIYMPLEGATFVREFQTLGNLLSTLLQQHTDTVFLNIPAYIGCVKRLLLSLVKMSDQERVTGDSEVTNNMVSCAYQLDRLFSLIATHKLEFGKVAVYVVADYVSTVQKVTLLPAIKRALVPCIYKMLDLCDTHAVSQLHVVLTEGVKSVFRLLYGDYTKFHRYSGKI